MVRGPMVDLAIPVSLQQLLALFITTVAVAVAVVGQVPAIHMVVQVEQVVAEKVPMVRQWELRALQILVAVAVQVVTLVITVEQVDLAL